MGKKKTPVKGRATKRAGKITFRGRTSKVKSRVMTPRKRSAGTVKTKKLELIEKIDKSFKGEIYALSTLWF